MQPGERLRLTVEKPAAGGRMIARHDGAIVLVSGAIPGESVEAVVERQQRGTVWARTTAVLEPSPDRLEDEHDSACGGNVLAHVRYERQLALKIDIIRDAFTRIGRCALPDDVPIEPSPRDGYRMRARLHVQRGQIGFYREGTHSLCDAAATGQLLPATVDTLRALEQEIGRLPGIDGAELELAENIPASERVAHILLPRPALGPSMRALPAIAGLTGLSASVPTSLNVRVIAGDTTLHDTLEVASARGVLAVTLERQAHAFFQGNRFLLAPLAQAVSDVVPRDRVLDLYAGVGLFAVTLAARGDTSVTAIEGDRTSAADLKANAAQCGRAVDPRHQPVEVFLRATKPGAFATVMVDPPRTGMSKEALGGAIALNAHRIVYVSCDVATLARDARMLVDVGYRLTSVRAFDLFPNTAHVETLAVFDRT